MPTPAIPQVKSLTFVTLRNELQSRLLQDVGEQTSRRLWDAFLPATRTTLQNAEPGAWVNEVIMLDAMRCILEVGFEEDDERYLAFLRHVAAAGISRFLKIFLSLTSPTFALRRVPTVWSHLRRNAGTVTTSRHDGGVRLLYTGFPFFGFHAYRLLSVANCQALVQAGTGIVPPVSIEDWSEDSLQLDFQLGA